MRPAVDSALRLQTVQRPEPRPRAELKDEGRDRELNRAIAELQHYLETFGVKKPQRPERPDPVTRLWPDVRQEQMQNPDRPQRINPGSLSQDVAALKAFLASAAVDKAARAGRAAGANRR
jgi:hypothetical protein